METINKQIKCPFTETVIYDDDGYREPFPHTLICYNDVDMVYLLQTLEIIEEITTFIIDVEFYFSLASNQQRYFKKLNEDFPWLNNITKDTSSSQVIAAHPLVKTILDNAEEMPSQDHQGGIYSFHFALAMHHQQILDDYEKLHAYLTRLDGE